MNAVPKNAVDAFRFRLPAITSSRSGNKPARVTYQHPSSALIAGFNIGIFPRTSLAFSATSGYNTIFSTINTRNAAAGVISATSIRRFGGVAMRASTSTVDETKTGKIPIVILGGFLGAGKTTALKRLLENTEGIKVGTIVNDVASVNIDAKLLSNPMNVGGSGEGGKSGTVGKGSVSGTVELQNGCAW